MIIYVQPSNLTVLGALEGIDGCSIWVCPYVFLQSIIDCRIFLSIHWMCEGRSRYELVFEQTILHWVWGSILDFSDGWYNLIRPNHICQQDCPFLHVPASIFCERFFPFYYGQSLRDLGDFGLIPIFLFLKGPVSALCENILPYSNRGLTFVRLTHVSPQLTHIIPPFGLLQWLQWYKAYVLHTSYVEKFRSDYWGVAWVENLSKTTAF